MYQNEAGVGAAIARLRPRPRRGLRHQQAEQRLPPARRRPARLRRDAGEARPRPDRPVPHPLAAADALRRRLRLDLEDPDGVRRRRPGPRRSASPTSSPPTSTGSCRRPAWSRRSTRSRCTPTSPTRPRAPARSRTASRSRPGRRSPRARCSTTRRSTRSPARHGKYAASQVTLRWHVERGDIVFPKSMHAAADAGELRDLRLRAHRRRGRGDQPRSTRARPAGPAPTRTRSTTSRTDPDRPRTDPGPPARAPRHPTTPAQPAGVVARW